MFTTSASNLVAILGTTYQTTFNWMAKHPDRHPTHYVSRVAPRGKFYRLADLVIRLREMRKGGFKGGALEAVVQHDADVRRAAGHEDLYIGEDIEARAEKLVAALDPHEANLLKGCMAGFTNAAVAAGCVGIARTRKALILHPGILRFVLTRDRSELPVGDLGWFSFAKAFCVMNVAPSNSEMEVA